MSIGHSFLILLLNLVQIWQRFGLISVSVEPSLRRLINIDVFELRISVILISYLNAQLNRSIQETGQVKIVLLWG